MDEPDSWRHMASAPKDGSRILVTIRASEQGPAEVDLAYWSHGDQFGGEGWRASDSSPGHIIEYAEPELKCWMPMPSANRTSMPSPGKATTPSSSTAPGSRDSRPNNRRVSRRSINPTGRAMADKFDNNNGP